MILPASYVAMFKDIEQDFDWALHHPETQTDGTKFWRDVVFAAPAGFRPLMMEVTTPKGPGPHPLVIFIHGGAWMTGGPTISTPIYREHDLFGRLHAAGYAVARISYRFSQEAQFPAQLHDCKAAIRYLRAHAAIFNVDQSRFAVMGDSAGGHLACLVGLTVNRPDLEGDVGLKEGSSAVSAIVNWFAPIDFLTMSDQRLDKSWSSADDPSSPESRLIGGSPKLNVEKAKAASPLTYVHKDALAMLIQHGDKDRLVPFAQAEQLYAAMKTAGNDVTLTKVKGADHCFWGVDGTPIVTETIAFFNRTIGNAA